MLQMVPHFVGAALLPHAASPSGGPSDCPCLTLRSRRRVNSPLRASGAPGLRQYMDAPILPSYLSVLVIRYRLRQYIRALSGNLPAWPLMDFADQLPIAPSHLMCGCLIGIGWSRSYLYRHYCW